MGRSCVREPLWEPSVPQPCLREGMGLEKPSGARAASGAGSPCPALPAVKQSACSALGTVCQAERLKAQSASFHLLLDNCCDAVTGPVGAASPPSPLPHTSSQCPVGAVDIFLLISFYVKLIPAIHS